MNRLQPIGLPVTIVARNNINAFSPMDFAFQVSEIVCPDRSKEHASNSNIAPDLGLGSVRQKYGERRKAPTAPSYATPLIPEKPEAETPLAHLKEARPR